MTEHTERDRFVLLPVQSNPAMAFNEVGVEYDYKAVTVGGVIGSAPRTSFTNDGAALRAYAPVHLGGGRVGDDIILTWERRERVSGGWVNGADVPVTDPLSFVITIYEDGTYAVQVRSSTVTFAEGDALTWTYTAAMQTADFGSPVVGPIYWAIYRSGPRGDGTIARGST